MEDWKQVGDNFNIEEYKEQWRLKHVNDERDQAGNFIQQYLCIASPLCAFQMKCTTSKWDSTVWSYLNSHTHEKISTLDISSTNLLKKISGLF